MKSTVVSSSWMASNEFRLDSVPYISGSAELKVRLDRLPVRKEPLENLAPREAGGLIEIGRIKRIWVDEADYGVPFLTSTNMLQADLSNIPLISKKTVQLHPELLVNEGWILIPRSGSIDQVVYCRPDMSGMACSENILRIVPDPDKILPGYLYAYLSSKFGIRLIASVAHGSIIPHITAQHIAHLPIPRLGELEILSHNLCFMASTLRTEAILKLKRAGELVNRHLQFPEKSSSTRRYRKLSTTNTSSINLQNRMNASFYDADALKNEHLIESITKIEQLADLVEINATEIFQRVFVSKEYGIPYLTKSDMSRYYYRPTKFLSKHQISQNRSWAINEGDLLLAQSGQMNESTAIGLWADERFQNSCFSTDILHLRVLDKRIPSGYLYAYLFLTDVGYRQIVRTMSGSSRPYLTVRDISVLSVPRTTSDIENAIDTLVREAGHLRAEAQAKEDAACKVVESALQDMPL